MRLPTPPEIADAPERAALASADHALELMCRSLVVTNPELLNQEPPDPAEPSHQLLDLAQELIQHAVEMQQLLERYAAQLDRDSISGFDDVTF